MSKSREERLAQHREHERERYRTDPEYRERAKARSRARWATPEHRAGKIERYRERYQTEPEFYENAQQRRRAYLLKTNYRMTLAQYDELLVAQGGVCACCGRPETRGNGWHLAVDHDHQTGQVRGLLCATCNTTIGLYGDDPRAIRRLLEYVERPRLVVVA